MSKRFEEVRAKFLDAWGNMGVTWGIGRTMARIHGLLMTAEKPLSTDDVMRELAISRGNANTNLRALAGWGIVRRVRRPGDRKEYFESEKDTWTMLCTVARERKRREIEPVIKSLESCLREAERAPAAFRERLESLLDILKAVDLLMGQLAQQQTNSVLPKLLKVFRQ